jgi:UDP-N-acetylmuramoylalanine--D-glutamate ligase
MIDLSFMRDRPVAVLGLGKTGLPSARALYASGVPVWAWDDKPEAMEAARTQGIDIADPMTAPLENMRTLLLSPGIPHSFPAPHPAVVRAREAGLEIVSDIELLVRADKTARFVGITGTNGKSTTTALIGHILKRCKLNCEIGGNLGPAVLGFDMQRERGAYVLELSSYQLELTPSLTPDVGILLNITPDHLERHGGMEGYVAAKRSLFRKNERPQTAIIGIDDEYCRAIADALKSEDGFNVVTLSVGKGPATIRVEGGSLVDTRSGFTANLANFQNLPGKHNWQNAAASYAAGIALGISADDILAAMRSFPGLDHRQQRIATVDGITFVNDSKATNADAAEKALSCYEAIYWIAGGLPKEGGLNGLEPLMGRVRHAFLIGKASNEFAEWLDGKATYTKCGTLDKAVEAAWQMASRDRIEDAVVLLSPACASWDQFRSFEHRGQVFTGLVRHIATEAVTS